ncbi:MAG: metal ABC transporter substrate-binding protein [Bacteroidota bacterium]|nr:metal ABC transporter substrate-binding protein [Bacteroidota bacterium]
MIKVFLYALVVTLLLPPLVFTSEKLKVVTTTADSADLIKVIGKDKIDVVSLTKGNQDPHFIEPRPSMVMKVKNANVLVQVGMDLDMWIQSLIDASRNSKIIYGSSGYVDASEKVEKLEIPTGKVDASMGDIHIYGNPHYWLDPENAKPILETILKNLSAQLPSDAEYFKNNYKEYLHQLDSAIAVWKNKMAPFAGSKIVTYHNSWPYFAKRFGLKLVDFVEPKPGIPPTPSHVISLIENIRNEKVKVIIMEPYFNLKVAESIAAKSYSKVVVLSPSIGGLDGIDTYLDLFDYNINKLVESLKDK